MMLLCERLSERLAADGARHAAAAAMALAVRGIGGVDPATFADQIGISRDELARAEAGEVPFDELPSAILQSAAADPRLDVDRLRLAAG